MICNNLYMKQTNRARQGSDEGHKGHVYRQGKKGMSERLRNQAISVIMIILTISKVNHLYQLFFIQFGICFCLGCYSN